MKPDFCGFDVVNVALCDWMIEWADSYPVGIFKSILFDDCRGVHCFPRRRQSRIRI